MILPLLLALQQPAPPAAEPSEDIVVVAQRLRKVRFSYHASRGQLVKCTIKRSGGSATAEAMVCEAARQCAAENPTTGDRHLAPCIRDRLRRLFAEYRARRSAASASQGPGQP